jgi:DNA-binding NtrC family response regulator
LKEKANIMIVDDNISLCKTMSLIFSRKGYDVTIANSGPEAIKRVKEKSFDIIFMDIKMPLMHGVETYKRIKKISDDVVVVMMTAYAVEDLVQEALDEGAYDVLYKPLNFNNVLEIIGKSKEARQGGFILLVDDDPGVCTTLKNILDKKGHKVCIAHTGEEAIKKAREETFDIIFLDMKLPTINGLETYLAIKEINPELVAILMTGYHREMADLVQEALNKDAYTCLYKPLNIENMLMLIKEILKEKQKAS